MAALKFDLDLPSLREALAMASHGYAADEVREIVLTIALGQNYRKLTEKATRLEISVFMAWILNLCHRAKQSFGDAWLAKLEKVCSSMPGELESRWLRVWLMGLALKTTHNLDLRVGDYPSYLSQIKAETDAAMAKLRRQTTLELHTKGLASASLSAGDSAWLLQIAGAAVLTLRGSKKSTIGKLLEKAVARAFLTSLGLREGRDYSLNLPADTEVDREIDAEIDTKRGKARMDIALIGTGNQEVSEDKLSRVGRNGIVLVDKLGSSSKVPANALAAGVKLIVIQNSLPLTDLYTYLRPLLPNRVPLKEPPTDEKGLRRLFGALDDSTFIVPHS